VTPTAGIGCRDGGDFRKVVVDICREVVTVEPCYKNPLDKNT
jgi:hypothetical protein